jgi:hypothetical protein
MTIKTEDEAAKFINSLWQSGSKFKKSNAVNSSFLVFFWVDFPLFHLITFASRYFILLSLVKYMCSLLLPYATLTTFCVPSSTIQKNIRNDEFTAKLFDAKYENNFELVKTFIDGGKVDVNIKNDCGDTPLIAICRLQNRSLYILQSLNYLCQAVDLRILHGCLPKVI